MIKNGTIWFFGLVILLCSTAVSAEAPKSWGYWLTKIDPAIVQQSEYDMVVIDYSRTGNDEFSADDVALMKQMPDGSRRKVISYFSIGEAEEYRFYWHDEWLSDRPTWLEKENPDWPENHKVRYWDKAWQKILFGEPGAYLDRIIAAGFDGIYLDIIDAFEYFEEGRPTAQKEMADLIVALSEYARRKNPDFVVITQNGERLLGNGAVLNVIDGAAKEDLYYGLEKDHIAAAAEEIDFSLQFLKKAQARNKFILIASYVPHDKGKAKVLQESNKNGFVPYFGKRALERLNRNRGIDNGAYETIPALQPTAQKTEVDGAVEKNRSTPGNFFLNTLNKGRLKSSVAYNYFSEKSIFEEFNNQGQLVFAENVRFREQQVSYGLLYGLSDQLEVGFQIPVVKTNLKLEEFFGGSATNRDGDSGIGTIKLLGNLSLPINDEQSIFSLFSLEVGLPTDTQKRDLKSHGAVDAQYVIEKFWNHVGLSAGVGVHYAGRNDFANGETDFSYRLGGLFEFSDKLYGNINYINRGGNSALEGGIELLTTGNSSLELFVATDLEKRINTRSAGLTFSYIH